MSARASPAEGGRPAGATSRTAARSNRVGEVLLILVALTLPFEAPLFRVGPLQITTVELALYTLLATWGLGIGRALLRREVTLRAALGALRADPLSQAALLWILVSFASAGMAPSNRLAALKFALRTLSGVLAFFATRTLAATPHVRRRVLGSLVVGALLSASTALIESIAPASAIVWSPFRNGAFDALGLPRASGVFSYPTIGAMYWEAALPLAVVAPFVVGARAPPGGARASVISGLASALLVWAILATATRSALVGGAAACLALLVLPMRIEVGVRRAAAVSLGVVLLSFGTALVGPESRLAQRLQWWKDGSWLRVEYVVPPGPHTVGAGEMFAVPVRLRNAGAATWYQLGNQATHLAYHWERLDGQTTQADFEGMRTELPQDVPPGGVIDIVAGARGPSARGAFLLRWDLVQEGVTWFSEIGNAMPRQTIEVTDPIGPGAPLSAGDRTAHLDVEPLPPSRPELWRASVTLWQKRMLLGIGPDNFRRSYQAVIPRAPNGQPYTDTRIHANSLYFETLADTGTVGLVALAALAIALVRAIRTLRDGGQLAGLGFAVAAAAFFVHGALDYFFEFTPLFGLFWVLLGLAAAAAAESPRAALEPGR